MIDLIIKNGSQVAEILSVKERKTRSKETKPRKALGRSLPKNPPPVPPAKEAA
jgi:hypothetical protein